jgi:spore coat polysaccharide biosynthesis predicted glycosyltransferase SpsG
VHSPPTLTEEFAAAPIVVTAGGVSMLEACALGRAVVAVVTAENHGVAVAPGAARGAVVAVDGARAGAAVAALARDGGLRRTLAQTAQQTIDGLGPQRLAEELDS